MDNLLVTGGCGFIGTNFIRYLLEESDFTGRIVNVDRLTYAGNPENLADVERRYSDRYVFVREDICNGPGMAEIFDRYDIDSVCHLAAESHVDRSISAPEAFIRTNVFGTYTLLELARERIGRIALFHHVSTDEVFGSLGKTGYFTEETPYKPNSPYSASKAASDHLVRAYHMTYGLPVTLSNCSNNFGPYQFPEKLIPLMILNASKGKPLPVYGDGSNVRDWLYVRDHCVAVRLVMKEGKRGESYIIGGNAELSNIDLVGKLCDSMDGMFGELPSGPRRMLIEFVKDRPGHDHRYAIDCSKIRRELGWSPQESFETGLNKTVRWYHDNPKWIDRVVTGEYRQWIASHYGE